MKSACPKEGAPVHGVHWGSFLPDGRGVVSCVSEISPSEVKTAQLWDLTTGKELCKFGENAAAFTALAFSPRGGHILFACSDNTLRLWDVRSGKEVHRFWGHKYCPHGWVTSLAISPDGRRALSGAVTGRCGCGTFLSSGRLIGGRRGGVESVNGGNPERRTHQRLALVVFPIAQRPGGSGRHSNDNRVVLV